MQLGMIGLGRMGANLVRRLMRDGHDCVVFDVNPDAVKAGLRSGRPERPRWRLRRQAHRAAGRVGDGARRRHHQQDHRGAGLDAGTGRHVIDGGNSYYRDDIRRAKVLAKKGIHLVDCGTSGGVWGRDAATA